MIDIEKIREQLPYGAQTEIAKLAQTTVVAVNRVLAGKSKDLEILNIVADYLAKHKAKQEEVNKKLAALIQ